MKPYIMIFKLPSIHVMFTENTSSEGTIIRWKCFLKVISTTHIIFTFVLMTLEDLLILMKDNIFQKVDSTNDYQEQLLNVKNCLNLPIFVYDCPLTALVDSYVNMKNTRNKYTHDRYEDHRFTLGDEFHKDVKY